MEQHVKERIIKMMKSDDSEMIYLAAYMLASLGEESCREFAIPNALVVWPSLKTYIFRVTGEKWFLLLNNNVIRLVYPTNKARYNSFSDIHIITIPNKKEDGESSIVQDARF